MAVDDRLAPVSYTSYLARASDLLERLTITTEGLLDNLFRTGKPKEPLLKTLGDIHRASRTLTAPSSSQATRVRHSDSNSAADSKLQKILFDCSADLLSRFAKLPQEALVFISWSREILKDIDAATREEPWALIGLSSSKALAALRQLVEDLRSMAGETHLVSKPPLSLWQRRRAQRGTAFHLACLDVRQRTSRRLSSVRDEVQHRLDALDLKLTAHTSTSLGDIPLWPPADVLITVALDGVEEWLPLVDSQWPSWREAAGADRDLTVVPVVNGRAVDTLTLGGYDSATPRAGTFRDWSEQIRIEVLRSPRADAFSAVVDALSEISGIQEFGYGTERRPVIEQRALSEAQARLDQAIRNLGGLMAIAPEITAAIDDFVDQVRTGVVRLARDTAAMLHGQPTATISAVVGITLALTAEDLKHVP